MGGRVDATRLVREAVRNLYAGRLHELAQPPQRHQVRVIVDAQLRLAFINTDDMRVVDPGAADQLPA